MRIKDIETDLANVEDQIANTTDRADLAVLIQIQQRLKTELDIYFTEMAMGSQIRSRATWVEKGEKNNNYFLNLEKKHQTNNLISSVKDKHGHNVYKSNEILEESTKFYQKLYSKSDINSRNVDEYLASTPNIRRLNDDESNLCEGKLGEEECEKALLTMSLNKSPGLDGLTVEFYRTFWNDIKQLVVDSFNEASANGDLAESHKQSVMTLIFKKGERDDLKNYRPISLSNTDYKLLACALAQRLQKVISKLISPEQTAYIKQRYIGNNIRLLLDLIEYAKKTNKPGILLFLDFQKAFDTLNWDFIQKCMIKMGFKSDFCDWIKVIYKNPKAFVKINGYLSQTIYISRGIRQGCPLSALLFIICTEVLAQAIKNNEQIHGLEFTVNGKTYEIKSSQYADDTCIFLQGANQIRPCLSTVQSFSTVSGLKLNLAKTEGLCIGSLHGTILNIEGIKWPTTPIRYLGIYIGIDKRECEKRNWCDKLEKIQKLTDNWRRRNLTLIGKIMILRIFALPLLLYPATMLPTPDGMIKKINKIFYNFIWGARDKIKRRVIINKIKDGGLNMVDIESQFCAVKAGWLSRIINNPDTAWSKLSQLFLSNIGNEDILDKMTFRLKSHMPCLTQIPEFYQDVISSNALCNKPDVIVSKTLLYNQILWGNSNFMVAKECLYCKSFIDSGILYVKDVLMPNGQIDQLLHDRLQDKKHYFSTMSKIITALKPLRNFRFDNNALIVPHIDPQPVTVKKSVRELYHKILAQKVLMPKTNLKWENDFHQTVDWEKVSQNKIKIPETKIAEFNYKVLHNILACNQNLFRWKKSTSKACIYCKFHLQDTKHLIWECNSVKTVWQKVSQVLKTNITWQHIVIGINGNLQANLIISVVSFLIYKKFQQEKLLFSGYADTNRYMKSEIQQKTLLYTHVESMQHVAPILNDLVGIL